MVLYNIILKNTSVLHADNRVDVAVLRVVQHNVSHVNVGERLTTSKSGRLIYVHSWMIGSRERAENEPMTIKYAESYQPVTNECAES